MSIARPAANIMRRPLQRNISIHVGIAFGLATVVGLTYKFLVYDWRHKQYANFYKTYDEKRHFERMAAAGVFQSVKPDAEAPQWVSDYEKEVDKAIAALKKK